MLIIYDSPNAHFQIVNARNMQKSLSPLQRKEQAKRALAEAEQRRKASNQQNLPPEKNGSDGPEATRFGDWEKNGLTSDF